MSLFPEDTPYRVLARKYRPADFEALIGQQAMVQTLANAIRHNRLAQAWLLTGVRGVGKTSTARILAKALNCIGADGSGGPTVHPCGVCANCTAIAAGQHLDVIEIDAASNTGVDNIREIIEAVRYAPVSARYKIYIIDEVHMLSKGAFNALLKTLEEPPPHVKFVFATTEVQKVPATILSRCQRFDLKRVPVDLLVAHFRTVADSEAVAIDDAALALIAIAAEGSVRDGLSILDQAISLAGDGAVTAALVRDMLGLADRGQLSGLLAAVLGGDRVATLAALDAAHAAGVEPERLIEGLLSLVHATVRQKLAAGSDPAQSEADQQALADWARGLSFPALHRLWQLLLAGHREVVQAPDPGEAADMVVLRLLHAAGLPDPERLARLLRDGGGAPVAAAPTPADTIPEPAAPPVASLPADARAIVSLFARRDALSALRLTDDAALVVEAPGRLYLGERRPFPAGFVAHVAAALSDWTATPWIVTAGPPRPDSATLQEEDAREADEARAAALADPLVRSLLDTFPGSELRAPVPAQASPLRRSNSR